MSILENIKKEALAARKARDSEKSTALVTLISEAEIIGKNDGNRQTTDAEVIQVIKKTIKNLQFTIDNLGFAESERFKNEKELLEGFLPKQMSEEEIEAKLNEVCDELNIRSVKQMGLIMKEFKSRYEGTYDSAVLAKMSKKVLG